MLDVWTIQITEIKNINTYRLICVLVSRWFVATAAHCVSRARSRDIAVWLGALDTTAGAHTARKLGYGTIHTFFFSYYTAHSNKEPGN